MLNPLTALKHRLSSRHLELMYMSFILPVIEYGSILYDSAPLYATDQLDKLHYRAALTVSGCIQGTNAHKLLKTLNWKSLSERRIEKKSILMHRIQHKSTPSYVLNIFSALENQANREGLRSRHQYNIPPNSSRIYSNSPAISLINIWKHIDPEIKSSATITTFKNRYSSNKYTWLNKCVLTTRNSFEKKVEVKLNRIRSDLALRSDYYRHNFIEFPDPSCQCGHKNQTKTHFLLDCPLTSIARDNFLESLQSIPDFNYRNFFTSKRKSDKVDLILFGNQELSKPLNTMITELSAIFIDQILDI